MDFHDGDNSVWSFLRKSKIGASPLLFVVNATPVVRPGYRVGVPTAGFWKDILNTDSALYGGTDTGNSGGIQADPDTPALVCRDMGYSAYQLVFLAHGGVVRQGCYQSR